MCWLLWSELKTKQRGTWQVCKFLWCHKHDGNSSRGWDFAHSRYDRGHDDCGKGRREEKRLNDQETGKRETDHHTLLVPCQNIRVKCTDRHLCLLFSISLYLHRSPGWNLTDKKILKWWEIEDISCYFTCLILPSTTNLWIAVNKCISGALLLTCIGKKQVHFILWSSPFITGSRS